MTTVVVVFYLYINSHIVFRDGAKVTSSSKSGMDELRLNVGFMFKQPTGYSRTITFDMPDPFHIEDVLFSNLDGTLRLSRTPQGILIQGQMIVGINTECVRCLSGFEYPFEVEINELFVLQTADAALDTDPMYHIDEGYMIDLSPIVREEGILALPIQTLCSPDCKGLCATCGKNLNEGPCDCVQDDIDPRLAVLRALLDE